MNRRYSTEHAASTSVKSSTKYDRRLWLRITKMTNWWDYCILVKTRNIEYWKLKQKTKIYQLKAKSRILEAIAIKIFNLLNRQRCIKLILYSWTLNVFHKLEYLTADLKKMPGYPQIHPKNCINTKRVWGWK